jgi:hypothetical protein
MRRERAAGYSTQKGERDLQTKAIGLDFLTGCFDAIRFRFECTQILKIERPKSVFHGVADSDNSIVQAVPKQNDERASTAAQLRPTDRARATRVESAIAFHSIFHPRIGVPDIAHQLLSAHAIR